MKPTAADRPVTDAELRSWAVLLRRLRRVAERDRRRAAHRPAERPVRKDGAA
jgi:hypothetical protein